MASFFDAVRELPEHVLAPALRPKGMGRTALRHIFATAIQDLSPPQSGLWPG